MYCKNNQTMKTGRVISAYQPTFNTLTTTENHLKQTGQPIAWCYTLRAKIILQILISFPKKLYSWGQKEGKERSHRLTYTTRINYDATKENTVLGGICALFIVSSSRILRNFLPFHILAFGVMFEHFIL